MPVFMFADISGFTAMTETHGDASASDLARRFEMLVRTHLPPEARLVKMIGDAAMVVATDVLACVLMARELLTAVEDLPGRPALRIGIQSGDAIERDGDYWGHAVNVAARLAAAASPSEILTTDAVKMQLDTRDIPADLFLEPAGRRRLRNVAGALDLFAIRPERSSFPTDPVCRMRLSANEELATLHFGGRTYHFCSLECTRLFSMDPRAYSTEDQE